MKPQIFENIDNYRIDNNRNIYFKQIDNNTLFLNNCENPLFTSVIWLGYELLSDQIVIFERSDSQLSFISKEINFKILNSENLSDSFYFILNLKDFILVKWERSFYNSLTVNDIPQEKQIFINDKYKWSFKKWGFIKFFDNLCLNLTNENIKDRLNYQQFTKLNFETGAEEWSFDLEQHLDKLLSAYPYEGAWLVPDHHPQIKEPIGVYKDQLWFSMKHYGLLCLNHHTGAFMHYLRDCPENDKRYGGLPYGNYPVIPHTENSVIVEDESKMVCFDGMYYWELNLQTLSLDFHYLEDYFRNEVSCHTHLTRFKKLIVENEKIYMVDNLHKKFGCFNRRTLKYDWIEPLPEGSGAPRSIEKHGNRLYIDTSKKELLVYELEGNE